MTIMSSITKLIFKEMFNMNENKNTTTNATTLTDNKELRQKYIDRIDVLDKVKRLLMIPSMELMTMRQVAEYYEVPLKTVETCYRNHMEEISTDGVTIKKPREIEEKFNSLENKELNFKRVRGGIVVEITDKVSFVIPNVGCRMFSKRAVLRFGMLLRDSVIAQEVRTQLLNMAESVISENPAKVTEEIENEQKYLDDIITAYKSGDPIKIITATSAHSAYQQRHITALEKKNEMLIEDNSILAGNILAWSNRASANKVVRLMAQKLSWRFGSCWNEIYNELLYRHNINLKSRHTKGGKKSTPLLEYLHEDEWKDLYQTIAAMLQARYVNPSEIFEKAKLSA